MDGGQILHEGNLTLTAGYCADLDSDAPNWLVDDSCSSNAHDLRLEEGSGNLTAYAYSMDMVFAPANTAASVETCASLTAYFKYVIGSSLKKRPKLCVRTSGHRYSWVEITGVRGDQNPRSVDLHVITYAKRYDD
ncbi:hypothetical protein ABZU32_30025 [Sphaerisporangium sp. NPDC005288]|uniref:hypothetical protein n=1 Tax=Sphaerisporangium sp. NPDC005288 TaxID=3155114 RepID=UPI0033A1754D